MFGIGVTIYVTKEKFKIPIDFKSFLKSGSDRRYFLIRLILSPDL